MKKTFQYIWLLHSKPLLLHPLSRGKDITNEMMEQTVGRVKFPVKYLILFLIRERERRASYIFFTSSGFGWNKKNKKNFRKNLAVKKKRFTFASAFTTKATVLWKTLDKQTNVVQEYNDNRQ